MVSLVGGRGGEGGEGGGGEEALMSREELRLLRLAESSRCVLPFEPAACAMEALEGDPSEMEIWVRLEGRKLSLGVG